MDKDDALQMLQENSFFNTKEIAEENPEIRIFFNKIAESINEMHKGVPDGKFVFLGKTYSIAPVHLLFVPNDKIEEFLNLVKTIRRSNGLSWEIAESDFFISIRIARVFLPWRSKVIVEIDNEELLVLKSFVEEYFARSEAEFVFSYDAGTPIGGRISNELNMGT